MLLKHRNTVLMNEHSILLGITFTKHISMFRKIHLVVKTAPSNYCGLVFLKKSPMRSFTS